MVNDLPASASFGMLDVLASGYNLSGAPLHIGGGIRSAGREFGCATCPNITIANEIELTASQMITDRGSLVINGAIHLNGHDLTFDTDYAYTVINGPIDGSGNVMVGRYWVTEFGGVVSASSPIVVTGDLNVSGSVETQLIRLEQIPNGAFPTLSGTGTVRDVELGNHAQLKAGRSHPVEGGLADDLGTLHTANLTFGSESAAIVSVENGPSGIVTDQIDVTGTVTIDSLASISVWVSPDTYPMPGQSFVLINNDGNDPVIGAFAGGEGAILEGPTYKFRLTYHGGDGNDVAVDALEANLPEPELRVCESCSAGVIEGNAVTFSVTMSNPSYSPVTVGYETIEGTAKGGEDFVLQSGLLTFAPGEVTKSVAIATIDDDVPELEEAFDIRITTVEGARLGAKTSHTYIIQRNDRREIDFLEVSPRFGPCAGGTEVTVHGSFFTSDDVAVLKRSDDPSAQGITAQTTVLDSTTLRFITPDLGPGGTFDLLVLGHAYGEFKGAFACDCQSPTIVSEPQSAFLTPGATAFLTVAAAGNLPLRYQWYEGERGDTRAPLPDGSGSTLRVTAQGLRSYWVLVSNLCGTIASAAATVAGLADCDPPNITAQPQGTTVSPGKPATLSFQYTSSRPATIQWYEGPDVTRPVAGATNARFVTPAVTKTTSYWARVITECGEARTSIVVVNVAGRKRPVRR
jgi:hypothetical protein